MTPSEIRIAFLLPGIAPANHWSAVLCAQQSWQRVWLHAPGQAPQTTFDVLVAPPDQLTLPAIQALIQADPSLGVLALLENGQTALAARRAGAQAWLDGAEVQSEFIATIEELLARQRALRAWRADQSRQDLAGLQKRLNWIAALSGIGRIVSATLDLDQILGRLLDAAVDLSGAQEGRLWLGQSNQPGLTLRAWRAPGEDFAQPADLPGDDLAANQAARDGHPQLLGLPGGGSQVLAPISGRGGVRGVLGVMSIPPAAPLQAEHLTLLVTLADYAAIAIENAALYRHVEINRQELNAILEHVADGVIVVDEHMRLLYWNPAAAAAFENDARNGTGQSLDSLVQQPDLLRLLHSKLSSLPERAELLLEDGRVLLARLTVIPGVGRAVTFHDITHIKQLDRLKSEFVSTVSHDLRSPLTAILGYVELLGRVGPLNEMQREFVGRVTGSVNNITALINDLLDLGRIEAGFDGQHELFDPLAMIHSIVGQWLPLARQRQQILRLDAPQALPPLFATPTRISQVLNNLVGNAVKYTHEGGQVDVLVEAADSQLIVQVRDNGPGIPLNDQPFIFDKFFRASNVAETMGTGLGLAIVKLIVDGHQGRIWVDSTPGQGAAFTVVLPFAGHSKAAAAQPLQSMQNEQL